MDWDAIKLFLALYRAGSARAVAAELNTSASTVTRRISQLEASLDIKLFNRHSAGFKLTEYGHSLLQVALRMEADACEIERKLQGKNSVMQGAIRLTVPSHFIVRPFIDYIAEFSELHSHVEIELIPSFSRFNLSRGEADIAIRLFMKDGTPPQDLIGAKLVEVHCANYAAKNYLESHDLGDASSANWIGWDDESRFPDWVLSSRYPHLPVRHRIADPLAQLQAAKAGLGLMMNACFVCDGEPELVRLPDQLHWHRFDVWMLSHPDLRDAARFRELRRFLKQRFEEDKHIWAGERIV